MGIFGNGLGFSETNGPASCCFITQNGTWYCTPGTTCIQVYVIGAGGKGGNGGITPPNSPDSASLGGGGGGGGGISFCTICAGIPSSVSVTVGNGNSCFGNLVVATKGSNGANGCLVGTGASTGCAAGGTGNYATGGYGGFSCTAPGQSTMGDGQTISGAPSGGGGGGSVYRSNPAGVYYASAGGNGGSGSSLSGITFGAAGRGGQGYSSLTVPGRTIARSTCLGLPYGAGGGGGAAGSIFEEVNPQSGQNGGQGVILVKSFF